MDASVMKEVHKITTAEEVVIETKLERPIWSIFDSEYNWYWPSWWEGQPGKIIFHFLNPGDEVTVVLTA